MFPRKMIVTFSSGYLEKYATEPGDAPSWSCLFLSNLFQIPQPKPYSFLSTAVIALPNSRGGYDYYSPQQGVNFNDSAKIWCSTTSDLDATVAKDKRGKKALTPTERFDRDRENKGYATWTLKQDFVKKIRNNPSEAGYVKLNPLIDLIQNGDYDLASESISVDSKATRVADLQEQADKFKDTQTLDTKTEAYINSVNLVNNLFLKKFVSSKTKTIRYEVWSKFNKFDEKDEYLVELRDAWNNGINGVFKTLPVFDSPENSPVQQPIELPMAQQAEQTTHHPTGQFK